MGSLTGELVDQHRGGGLGWSSVGEWIQSSFRTGRTFHTVSILRHVQWFEQLVGSWRQKWSCAPNLSKHDQLWTIISWVFYNIHKLPSLPFVKKFLSKYISCELTRWLSGQGHLPLLQRNWVHFPVPPWWLITTCNSSFRKSNALFWFCGHWVHMVHTQTSRHSEYK